MKTAERMDRISFALGFAMGILGRLRDGGKATRLELVEARKGLDIVAAYFIECDWKPGRRRPPRPRKTKGPTR